MSLRALRTLIAIAQPGSFARATEAVHLTQFAVSLHVRSLEEEFNAPLFDGSKRLAVLTEAGHFAVERAREILSLYHSIAAELDDGSDQGPAETRRDPDRAGRRAAPRPGRPEPAASTTAGQRGIRHICGLSYTEKLAADAHRCKD